MEKISNDSCKEHVLIRGFLHYEDNIPVKNAIVILEKHFREYNEELQMDHSKFHFQSYTITNREGEFCFMITDKTSYYKIKVFDNHQC